MNLNRIYEWARVQPNKVALVHNGIPVDYLTFARAIEANRIFFEARNIPAKGPAVVAIGNIADSWFTVLALQALGFDTICAPSLVAAKGLNVTNMACLVVTEAERAGMEVDDGIAKGAPFIVAPRMRPAEIAPDQLPLQTRVPGGHILYTSGTTGENKKLLLVAAATEKRTARQVRIRSLGPDTIQHCGNFGLWAAAGWSLPIDPWHVGGTAVIDQRTDSAKRFFEQKVNRTFLTPPLLRELLDVRGSEATPVEGFELSVGSGFLSLDLAMRARKHLATTIKIGYGSSECTAMGGIEFNSEEDLHWLEPQDDRAVEIVDGDDRPCEPGQEGKIRVQLIEGDCISYLDDEKASAEFFKHGFFYPGDLGVFREDGKFRVLGRAGDVLNMQGIKVPVAPLEGQLQLRLGVTAVCLFSGLSDDGKDELVVAVEGAGEPDKQQVEAIKSAFAGFERIRFETLKAFPRTTGGTQKINREALRKLVFPPARIS